MTDSIAVNSYQAGSVTTNGGVWSKDGTKYYSVNQTGDTISIVDVATNTQEDTFAISEPLSVAVGPEGKLYVAHTGTVGNTNRVSVLSADTGAVLKTIDIPCVTDSSVGNITFDYGDKYYYVSCALDGVIKKVETATDTVIDSIDVSGQLPKISSSFTNLDNTKLYLMGVFGQTGDDKMLVVDTTSGAIIQNIALSASAMPANLSPDGQYIYVNTPEEFGPGFQTNFDVISTASDQIVDTVDTSAVGIPGMVTYTSALTASDSVQFSTSTSQAGSDSPAQLSNTGSSQIVGLLALIGLISPLLIFRLLAIRRSH